VVCCQLYIAKWAVRRVSFFDYVSVGSPGIPRSEAGYDHLFFSAEFGRVILPACCCFPIPHLIISSFPSLLSVHGFLFLHPFYQVLGWISFSIVNLLSQSVFCRLVCRLILTNFRVTGYPYQTYLVSRVVYKFPGDPCFRVPGPSVSRCY
jgi:hypothetical protein